MKGVLDLSPDQLAAESEWIDTGQRNTPRRIGKHPAPASSGQSRLFLLQQLDPQSAHYNQQYVLRLDGSLDVEALRQALRDVVQRHEGLRARFEQRENGPVQVIDPATIDMAIRAVRPEAAESELARIAELELRAPFDLIRGPAYRCVLLKFGEQRHALVLTVHHIVIDGWSADILIEETAAYYRRRVSDAGEPDLPPLLFQYPDFAQWQAEQQAQPRARRDLEYWTKHLQGVPSALDLPSTFPRPATQTYTGASHHFEIPAALAARLRTFARSERSSLFMVLFSLAGILISRYSGQEDLVLGTPVAGRELPETERLIGFFVNTLALRLDFSGEPSFREILRRARNVVLDGFQHGTVPFDSVVEALRLQRDLSRNPLFQVMVTLKAPRQVSWDVVPGLRLVREDLPALFSMFDLTIVFGDGDTLTAELVYNTSLFDHGFIDRMAGHFLVLADRLTSDADAPVSGAGLTSDLERSTLLNDWNATEEAYDQTQSIHGLFEAQARHTPDAVALICGPRELTYRELDERSNQLAHYLRRRGVRPESTVGICLPRNEYLLIAVLGVLKAGGAYVPLDPAYPADRLRYMVSDSRARLVLCANSDREFPDTEALNLEESWERIASEPMTPIVDVRLQPRNAAYIIYTSGSTGMPKGVVIEHAATVAFLAWARRVFSPAQMRRTLASTSLNFDLSVFEMFAPLTVGGAVVIVENVLELMNGAATRSVTLVNTVPSAAAELARVLPESVEVVNVAGEPLQRQLVEQLYANRLLENVCNLYGPTETTTYSTWASIGRHEHGIPTIGKPIANTRVYVLDRNLALAPAGIPGELFIGGAGLSRGYANRLDLTASRYIPDPFSPTSGARMYRTGDLVRWRADGNIEFLGRIDHQVKIRGFRIELGEVEAALASQPEIGQVAVTAIPIPPGGKQLVAYVTPSPGGARPVAAVVRDRLRKRLPEFMLPSWIVVLDDMPRTLNGKIDRKALPAPQDMAGRPEPVAPTTETERVICGFFAGLLNLKLDQVSIEESFFELGGHSLIAFQTISRLRDAFGCEIPLRALFESPTPRALAGCIDRMRKLAAPSGPGVGGVSTPAEEIPQRPSGEPPLASYAQQRLLFLQEFDRTSGQYNVPLLLRLRGALSARSLTRALEEIAARHEVLRTHFAVRNSEAIQVIRDAEPLNINLVDLTGIPVQDLRPRIDAIVRNEARRVFDLTTGPVWRQLLIRAAEEDHYLLITAHHIAIDGWSLSVLGRELAALYQPFSGDRLESTLPPFRIQYADYAVWQREQLRGEALQRQLRSWKRQLEGASQALELPTSWPRPAIRSDSGASHGFRVPPDITANLKRLCRDENVTLFMGLLAAYNLLLFRHTGQTDLLVGTPVAGRARKEVEDLIGFFVNTLVLRGDLSGDPTFRDLLRRIRSTTLNAYANQDVPIEKLVEEIAPARDTSRSPLFQTMLVLQNTPTLEWRLPGVHVTAESVPTATSKFDITLFLREMDGGLNASFVYSDALFDRTYIENMSVHFINLLGQVVDQPAERASALAMLSSAEVTALTATRQCSDDGHWKDSSVVAQFEEQVNASREEPALVYEGRVWTYRELAARSGHFAADLRSRGIGAGSVVAIHSQRTPGAIAAILGVLKAGAAYAPVDTAQPAERVRVMVEDMGAALVADETILQSLEDTPLADLGMPEEQATIHPASAAYLIFTSGSTGRPKGVVVEHRQIAAYVCGVSLTAGFAPGESFALVQPLHVDASATFLFGALANGGCLHLLPDPKDATSVDRVARYLGDHAIDYFKAAPSHLAALQELVPDPASLLPRKALFVGGEASHTAWLDRLHALRPDLAIFNQYGPTEATVGATLWRYVPGCPKDSAPLGCPLPGVEVYILDAQGNLTPQGVPGELCIGGAGVTRGYRNAPAATSERFVPDAFSGRPGARMYRTGDMARWAPDGRWIEYLGREDDQVKIRGYRVELGEIETTLASIPNVRESACVLAGEQKALAAFLAWHNPSQADLAGVRARLREKLPDYMQPAHWTVVDRLPRTRHGKVDRHALASMPLDALFASAAAQPDGRRVEPRDALERLVALIWARTLKRQAVGVDENFFDLGGHSLVAMQIASRVRQVLDIDVPLRLLFESPTVSRFSEALCRNETSPGKTLRVADAFEQMRAAKQAKN